jgi:hypothetical protein
LFLIAEVLCYLVDRWDLLNGLNFMDHLHWREIVKPARLEMKKKNFKQNLLAQCEIAGGIC